MTARPAGPASQCVFGGIAVTGPSTISNAFLNNGGVTIASAVTLTLSNDTVTGTTFTDAASSTGRQPRHRIAPLLVAPSPAQSI